MSRNVARGTLLGIAGQGWHLVTVLFLYAFLARRFGPALFGSWQVAISVLAWFEIFVVAGVAKVATKAISESLEQCRNLAAAAYIAQVTIALAVFALLLVLAQPIARLLSNPSLAPLLRIAALDIPLFALFMVASSVVLGVGRFERQAVAWIVYATAKAALIATLVAVGYSVAGALVGNALSSLVGFAMVLVPIHGTRPSRGESRAEAIRMSRASWPFLSLALTEGLGQSADLWLVSAIVVSSLLVGFYASAAVLATIPVFLFLGLNRVIFPSVARARAEGDGELVSVYTTQAIRLALIVTVMGVAFFAATGHQVIRLVFGAKYLGAYAAAALLMVAGMGRTVRATCTEILMAEDRRREALTLLAATVVFEIALVVALTPRFGLVGAATGAAASALIAAAWGAVLLRTEIGTRPLATLARCVVAAGLVAIGLAYVVPPPTSPVPILALATAGWLAVGTLVYGVLLRVLGEFGTNDVNSVRAALGWRAS